MLLKKWDQLPAEFRNDAVKKYYDVLEKKKYSLLLKRLFDIFASLLMLIALAPLFMAIAVAIKIDSKGPVFYTQARVTQYGKQFLMLKFRTMKNGADSADLQLTLHNDPRITRVGKLIRRYRLDEAGQLVHVLCGTMTLVGTRPEVPGYVGQYTPEMMATLLLPAGITSEASIMYRNEEKLFHGGENADEIYTGKVLPGKMQYNLCSIAHFSLRSEIKTIFRTVFAVFGKHYPDALSLLEHEEEKEKTEKSPVEF